jgi:glycosyltransferase involved in cell wall biosynthesis
MSPNTIPSVSVIVPVYNGGPGFRKCLSCLDQAAPPPDEIIVVGDGDTDRSSCWAEAHGVRVLRLPTRGGPARARNVGARAAQGEILFFVDADVAIHPDAVHQVLDAFQCEPDLAAVFGSYDDKPAETNFLSQYKNLLHHYVHQTGSEEASTFWAGCGAVRRDVFLTYGGFDERYRQPCIEDIELGYRLRTAGYRIKLRKTLQGKHLKRWTVLSLLKADFFKRALPWIELIVRDRRMINDLNLDQASRASVMMVYGLLCALVGSAFWLGALVFAGTCVLGLLVLNADLYRFFWHKRGPIFALQTIPWHWLYYLYCGLAFVVGTARYLLEPAVSKKPESAN